MAVRTLTAGRFAIPRGRHAVATGSQNVRDLARMYAPPGVGEPHVATLARVAATIQHPASGSLISGGQTVEWFELAADGAAPANGSFFLLTYPERRTITGVIATTFPASTPPDGDIVCTFQTGGAIDSDKAKVAFAALTPDMSKDNASLQQIGLNVEVDRQDGIYCTTSAYSVTLNGLAVAVISHPRA